MKINAKYNREELSTLLKNILSAVKTSNRQTESERAVSLIERSLDRDIVESARKTDELSKAEQLYREAAGLKKVLTEYYAPIFENDAELRSMHLAGMVRIAEDMEREADELSGFVNLQKGAHRISIVLPETRKKGKFTAGVLGKLMEHINTLCEKLQKSAG